MGINDFSLSDEIIAALYPESLVLEKTTGERKKIPAKAEKPGTTPVAPYPFLGQNSRSISFLVHYPDSEFIPGEQLIFLLKILTACKCSLDDIALVNTAKTPVKMDELKRQLHPGIIFLWGQIPAFADMTKKFPDMSLSLMEGITVIPVSQAEQMGRENAEAVELKKKLWVSLKKLFSL
jgi:hypothetical protein